jgi:hypothetical protein
MSCPVEVAREGQRRFPVTGTPRRQASRNLDAATLSRHRRLATESVAANAIIHSRLLEARDEAAGDADYATLQQRWDDSVRRIVDDGLDRVSHLGLRERVQTNLSPTLADARAAVAREVLRRAVAQHAANRDAMLHRLVQHRGVDPNDTLIGGGIHAYEATIDDAEGPAI